MALEDTLKLLLTGIKDRQTELDKLATAPIERGIRRQGQTTADFFRNPSPTQNRALAEFSGGILDRNRRLPGIAGVNQGLRNALDIVHRSRAEDRNREFLNKRLGQESAIDVIKALPDSILTGGYSGTGVEQQHLSNYLKFKNGTLPADDPRVKLAIDYLTRQKTTVTPQGTEIRPGYSLPEGGGGGGTSGSRTVEKPLTEGERKADFVNSNLVSLNSTAEEILRDEKDQIKFRPGLRDAAGQAMGPFKGYLQSSEYIKYHSAADEWATLMVFLRSGATARQEEKDSSFANFWPQPGEEDNVYNHKRELRRQAMANATKLGRQAGRVDASGNITAKGKQEAAALGITMPGTSSGPPQGLPTVNSQADFDALPSGTTFVEDGQVYRKP